MVQPAFISTSSSMITRPQLGILFIPHTSRFFWYYNKSIAANYSAGLYHHIVADDAVIQYRYLRMNEIVFLPIHMIANKSCWINISALPDLCRITVYCFGSRWKGPEMIYNFTISLKGFSTTSNAFPPGTSASLLMMMNVAALVDAFIVVLGMINQIQGRWFYFMYLVNTCSIGFFVADKFCVDKFSDPLHRNWWRKLHTYEFAQRYYPLHSIYAVELPATEFAGAGICLK